MAFGQADISTTVPADGDQISQGAQRIRELATAVRERLASLVVNVNSDPLQLKAGAIPSGFALPAPAITGGTHSGGTFANPTFSGTITGLPPFYPPYSRAELATGASFASTGVFFSQVTLSLNAGTYLIIGSAALQLIGNGITIISGSVRLTNNINGTTATGTQQHQVGSTGITLRLDTQIVVTELLTLASAGVVTLAVASTGANSTSLVRGTDGPADTSITAIRVA